jgi:hypothetical protein
MLDLDLRAQNDQAFDYFWSSGCALEFAGQESFSRESCANFVKLYRTVANLRDWTGVWAQTDFARVGWDLAGKSNFGPDSAPNWNLVKQYARTNGTSGQPWNRNALWVQVGREGFWAAQWRYWFGSGDTPAIIDLPA